MKVYLIKFGEHGSSRSYTDDAKIAADSFADALQLAQKLSTRNIKEADENFISDKNSDWTEDEQREEYHSNATKSWEITSIIFESELTSI